MSLLDEPDDIVPDVLPAPEPEDIEPELLEPDFISLEVDDFVSVLELGLAAIDVPSLLDASAQPETAPGTAPLGEPGVRVALRRDGSVLATGRALGFEALCFNVSLGCSWLCNGLEVPVARELGIRPNSSGLLSDPEEARRAVAYISRDDVGAEPGLWLPWLLLEHSFA